MDQIYVLHGRIISMNEKDKRYAIILKSINKNEIK